MNDERRKEIAKAMTLLQDAVNIIEAVKDEEQDSFDNMPESFQQGDKGSQMEEGIQALESAVDSIQSAEGDLDNLQ